MSTSWIAAGLAGLIAAGTATFYVVKNNAPATPVNEVVADSCGDCCAVESAPAWSSFVTARHLAELQGNPRTLVIDVRPAVKYAEGHIPGAINLPGNDWRTPSVKPAQGESQDIFRAADGSPDVARYEQYLSHAGVRNDHAVIIYGEHGGKADGTVPAMILGWLGHQNVKFLDGIGVDQWKAAGLELSTEAERLEASAYKANPAPGFLWELKDVVANLKNDQVVFLDTRSPKEFSGEEKRDNQRGGHIPGAVLCDYEDLLTKEARTTLPAPEVKKLLAEKNVTPDKTVVLYCQTATRVSHTYLALKDLGYSKVAIYDQSWHEYGNRDDTPIARAEESGAAK